MGMGSLGTFGSGQATAASLGPKKGGGKRSSYEDAFLFGVTLSDHISWQEGGI